MHTVILLLFDTRSILDPVISGVSRRSNPERILLSVHCRVPKRECPHQRHGGARVLRSMRRHDEPCGDGTTGVSTPQGEGVTSPHLDDAMDVGTLALKTPRVEVAHAEKHDVLGQEIRVPVRL